MRGGGPRIRWMLNPGGMFDVSISGSTLEMVMLLGRLTLLQVKKKKFFQILYSKHSGDYTDSNLERNKQKKNNWLLIKI